MTTPLFPPYQSIKGFPINTPTSKLSVEILISPAVAAADMITLMDLPLIEKPEIRIYGKVCRQQRNVGFFAAPGVPGYKYSGQQTTVTDIAQHPILQRYLDLINDVTGGSFNGVLVNLYKDGTQYISAHSDDERGLDDAVGVASISFGATRTFRIRDKATKAIVVDVQHEAGQMMVMSGAFQREYTHEIPVQKRIRQPRISLTFRRHIS